jgi:hypothetical protein
LPKFRVYVCVCIQIIHWSLILVHITSNVIYDHYNSIYFTTLNFYWLYLKVCVTSYLPELFSSFTKYILSSWLKIIFSLVLLSVDLVICYYKSPAEKQGFKSLYIPSLWWVIIFWYWLKAKSYSPIFSYDT